ncbi:PadR family transcriptional regulator [Salipiger mangrovisoli]|uniref:PadR family transcriptional regulator n=1 Tax=Salipiger mangrovisoli TaxID=2865933 RepID=A0ABR9X4N9_9RHOB|nr:PadR family transcriptional regulator [Salipiger mangrovisoli]MBE9638511.1 PadR family transcriptional regulator [Salipiger mangrovisoli]
MRHDKHTRHEGRGQGSPGRGGQRGKRLFEYGELRLLILSMIAEQPRHGYELIKAIEARFDGAYSPSPGVIYPTLSWLEDMGYVQVEPDASGRKRARLTPEGTDFLSANRAAAEDLLTRKPPAWHRGNAPKEIVAAMDEIKLALRRRMAAEGTDKTLIATLAAQLRDTARAIAGDTPDAPSDDS